MKDNININTLKGYIKNIKKMQKTVNAMLKILKQNVVVKHKLLSFAEILLLKVH